MGRKLSFGPSKSCSKSWPGLPCLCACFLVLLCSRSGFGDFQERVGGQHTVKLNIAAVLQAHKHTLTCLGLKGLVVVADFLVVYGVEIQVEELEYI
jgi:hypothetical protein